MKSRDSADVLDRRGLDCSSDVPANGAHPHSHDHGPAHAHDANPGANAPGCEAHEHSHAAHDHGSDGHGHSARNHDHGHGAHGHSHAHHHALPQRGHGRAFAIAITLNVGIVVMQAIYGVLAHSTALLADAGHNLSDVLGLLLAWGATWLGQREPSARFTFGLGSSSILASLANAALLLFASGAIAWEAIQRISEPAPVAGATVMIVALIGIAVNGVSAWLFMRGSQDDLNVRGAFLHMLGDAAVSAGVAISGVVVLYTGWNWVDPAMSLVVVLVIVYGTWSLLAESVRLMLNAVPASIDAANIEAYLGRLPGVTGVHDLHVWALSTTENSLTAHLVMPKGHPGDAFLDDVAQTLLECYSMHHATLQVDLGTSEHRCSLARVP
jgi:cobalt-zinc-cadmium efflux system protein